jgi:hypothetical protein
VDKDTRLYEVRYNSTIYKAYAKADETYRAGDQVYVNVPGGDYSGQVKLIMGKYTSDKDNALEYIDPFSRIVFSKTVELPLSSKEPTGNTISLTRASEQELFSALKDTTLSGYDMMGIELGLLASSGGKWGITIGFYDENEFLLHSVNELSPYVFSSDDVIGNSDNLFPSMR